jgi:hypothetical protein
MLRDGALSDPEVVSLVNDEFVPVWVNVRTSPLPDLACMDQVIEGIKYDSGGYLTGSFNRGFFVRSVVLASDGETLLNPQKPKAALGDLFTEGHFPYAQVKAKHYLPMLREALDRARSLQD